MMNAGDDDTPSISEDHKAPTAEDGQDSFLSSTNENEDKNKDVEAKPENQADANDISNAKNAAYRVLARKYRPHRFEDLVGQEAMVQTLRNAFSTGRIAQAYMLTGLRGIGKTTTARIIARALNYDGVENFSGPSVDMPELGTHCSEIMQSQHMDVLEMDAASNRGIGDIRELISNVQYAPVLSRYKVYILDEVHMLTTEAFNALLKTLEEPPPHVKFIFATTDPRKVPVTILSRCQRFDLKRLDIDIMKSHLAKICKAEDVHAEEEALGLIARASEGSVRDALSLLDQAIVLSENQISADHIQNMMGLAGSLRTVEMIKAMLTGDMESALTINSELMGRGADPHTVLSDIADIIHGLTRYKILGDKDSSITSRDTDSATILKELAASLSHAILSRAWQLLIAGIDELKRAPDAAQALDMIIIRVGYAAHLPPPDKLLAQIKPQMNGTSGGQTSPVTPSGGGAQTSAIAVGQNMPANPQAYNQITQSSPALRVIKSTDKSIKPASQAETAAIVIPRLDSFKDIVAFVGEKRDIKLKFALENDVVPITVNKGHIALGLKPSANTDEIRELGNKLHKWTGQRWMIALSEAEGEVQTLRDEKIAYDKSLQERYERAPEVKKILEAFPGAYLQKVREISLPMAEVDDIPLNPEIDDIYTMMTDDLDDLDL